MHGVMVDLSGFGGFDGAGTSSGSLALRKSKNWHSSNSDVEWRLDVRFS